MPIRTFAAYERPSSSDFNRYFMQQTHVFKTADESTNTDTTMTADTHLFLSVAANTDYWMTGLIFYDASTAGDLKIGWTGPSGATLDWVSDGPGSSATSMVGPVSRTAQSMSSTPSPGGVGVGTQGSALVKGLLSVGSTAGTFTFRWAQLASDAGNTTVRAGSMISLRRLTL